MKRLIIADVKSQNDRGKLIGHNFYVAQNYLDNYRDYCQVKIAGGPIFKTYFDENDCFLLPYDSFKSQNRIKKVWRILMNCKYLFKHTLLDDYIIVQQSALSSALMGIALFAKKKRNIFIISYDCDLVSSSIKRVIFKIAKNKIKGLLCSQKRVAKALDLPHYIVPDYIYSNDNKQPIITSYEDKKYDIAIVGGITRDKGVIEAAQYLVKTNYKVLIAGKTENEQLSDKLKEVCKSAVNIELHITDIISYNTYYKYIREARFCLLNYMKNYDGRSSGVALDIIFNRTPILGHRCLALSFVENENIGLLYDDIKDLDRSVNIRDYNKYKKNIEIYLTKHQIYKYHVIKFLGLA